MAGKKKDEVVLTIKAYDAVQSIVFPRGIFNRIAELIKILFGLQVGKQSNSIEIVSILFKRLEEVVKASYTSTEVDTIDKSNKHANSVGEFKIPQPASKSKSPLSEADREVIDVWREVYKVPTSVRVFYPAIKACLKNLRKELSQVDIVMAVRASVGHPLAKNMGSIPPLSGLRSEKMIGHLLMAASSNEPTEETKVESFRNYMLFSKSQLIRSEYLDDFIDAINACKSTEEMQTTYERFLK